MMKLAMIGLGKMGANMARRLHAAGHELVLQDVMMSVTDALAAELSISSVSSCSTVMAAHYPSEVIALLPAPRVVWLMVPHPVVDQTIEALIGAGLSAGDVIVDGGNSHYTLSQKRARRLQQVAIHFVDCGTSGGIWGRDKGYSLMLGGSDEALAVIEPALKSLAPSATTGWGHVGPAGAGHYVKMVHNGIEYGLMQAYAEGFELMQSNPSLSLDMQQIAAIWRHGSVVRSWLLDLIGEVLDQPGAMSGLSDFVEDSGEGRWAIQEATDNAVPTPVLALALQMRFRSRQSSSYAGKILNAMRSGFGGHPIKPEGDAPAERQDGR